MTMTRVTIPGLADEADWYELGYETGDTDFPLARLRVVPIRAAEVRIMEPNLPAAPGRIVIRMSASLVDEEGQVLALGGQLLIGPEQTRQWQFDSSAEFDPEVWLDGGAEALIEALLRQARGLQLASAARLLAAVPSTDPEA